MNPRRAVLAVVVLAVVAAGFWFWSARGREIAKVAELAQDVNVEAVMERVELSRGADGRTEWRLTADGADYLREQGLVRLTNPRITYFRPNGAEVKVFAPQGEVSQETGDAGLWPDVVIVSGPDTIHAQRLDYAGRRREIELSGGVRLDRGDMVLTAPRLTMQLSSNDITARGGVRSELWPQRTPAKESRQ